MRPAGTIDCELRYSARKVAVYNSSTETIPPRSFAEIVSAIDGTLVVDRPTSDSISPQSLVVTGATAIPSEGTGAAMPATTPLVWVDIDTTYADTVPDAGDGAGCVTDYWGAAADQTGFTVIAVNERQICISPAAAAGGLSVGDMKLSCRTADHSDSAGCRWGLCDGTSHAATSFPAAASVLSSVSWPYGGAAAWFQRPDFRDRFVVMPGFDVTLGDDDGRDNDGSRDPIVHNHAITGLSVDAENTDHTHTIDEDTNTHDGSHQHGLDSGSGVAAGGDFSQYTTVDGGVHNHHLTATSSGMSANDTHDHTLSGSVDNKTAWPAYGTGNWFMRLT